MNLLPEIINLIFEDLPCHDIIQCRQVNKTWCQLTKTNRLWQNRFIVDYGKPVTNYINVQWEDIYKKHHDESVNLDFHEKLRWSIKARCIALAKRLVMHNKTFPLEADNYAYSSYVYLAAVRGLTDIIDMLITHGRCHPDDIKQGDSSPLYVACQERQIETVALLLKHKANMEFSFREGFTPLYVTCQRGHVEIAKMLIDAGANMNAKCIQGSTPLYIACQEGRLDIVKLLLSYHCDTEITFRRGFTPLYVAAKNGHHDVVKILIDYGVRINCRDEDGSTPVYVAAQNGHNKVLEVLLNAGAHPEIEFLHNFTPLYVACQNGHHKNVSLLCKQSLVDINKNMPIGIGSTSVYIACQNGYVKVVRKLLKHKVNLDADGTGFSPFYVATVKGHYDVVKLLLIASDNKDATGGCASGIDVNYSNKIQPTALYAACHTNRLDIVKLLLLHGADPAIPCHIDCNNIMQAAIEENNDTEVIQHLVDVAPQLLFKPNDKGVTPCAMAYDSKNLSIIKVIEDKMLSLINKT